MTVGAHKCPAPGCEKAIPRHMLACRQHWFQIPKPLRDDVWAAYDNGRGMGSAEHSVAVAGACAFLRKEVPLA